MRDPVGDKQIHSGSRSHCLIKNDFGFRRFLITGKVNVRIEMLFLALGFNLKKRWMKPQKEGWKRIINPAPFLQWSRRIFLRWLLFLQTAIRIFFPDTAQEQCRLFAFARNCGSRLSPVDNVVKESPVDSMALAAGMPIMIFLITGEKIPICPNSKFMGKLM